MGRGVDPLPWQLERHDFYSLPRACAARTRAYFSLVGKVGKSTPEPAVLDSLTGDASGITSNCFANIGFV